VVVVVVVVVMMMVSSVARMVQAGKSSDSRWKSN